MMNIKNSERLTEVPATSKKNARCHGSAMTLLLIIPRYLFELRLILSQRLVSTSWIMR
jgi:hypothetical protein